MVAFSQCRLWVGLIDWANLGSVWGTGNWESAPHLRGELQVRIKRLIPSYMEHGCKIKPRQPRQCAPVDSALGKLRQDCRF